ncbi:SDR family oxidoreductase [Cesiribacter andamanensis]|uniref:NAD(P)H azoreductase n=1 Tax=Cesiribacter andamanensis AMV16 TaxID=1279009 RepID=M7NZN3_9BACT|nr:SDR family oxidoreductase [Cesiribacter andamanensis]EMR03804.1 NAD(P)H azoreductase [Cesiribacter andamanensis AMV16]
MKILVAGSHGKVGHHLVKMLSQKGHEVLAMIRDSSQADEMQQLGSKPVVADLEKDKTFPLEGVNAVFFVACSGPDTGEDKTRAVDEKGAIKLIEDAYKHKVQRFIMLSSIGADDPRKGPSDLKPYLEAKHQADKELKFSGILFTILRASRLTNDAGTGKIRVADKLENHDGSISREDVAKTMVACLDIRHTENKVFELTSGDSPIADALVNLPLV